MLVLGIFPFGSYALLEEVVVGFEAEFGGGGDVVLVVLVRMGSWVKRMEWVGLGGRVRSYVDAPEFFDGVECDDFLEQVVPVIALLVECVLAMACAVFVSTDRVAGYLSTGGLGEPQSPLVHERVLHVEVLGVMEDGDLVRRGGDRRDGILVRHGVTILHGSHGG